MSDEGTYSIYVGRGTVPDKVWQRIFDNQNDFYDNFWNKLTEDKKEELVAKYEEFNDNWTFNVLSEGLMLDGEGSWSELEGYSKNDIAFELTKDFEGFFKKHEPDTEMR